MALARLDVDERRRQLLATGLTIFSRRPVDAVSVEEIAAEGGVSRGLLYHYFPSKSDFYAAVVEHAAAELRARLDPDPALPRSVRLQRGLEAYVAFAEEHSAGFVTLLRGGSALDPRVREAVEVTRVMAEERVLEGLGDTAQPSVRLALRGWTGFIEAATLQWLSERAVAPSALVDLFLRVLTEALATARAGDAAR